LFNVALLPRVQRILRNRDVRFTSTGTYSAS